MDESEKIYNNLKLSGKWDDVFIVDDDLTRDVGNYLSKAKRIYLLRDNVHKLIVTQKMDKIVAFSFGSLVPNIFTNDKYVKDVYLGEDGCAPYYGLNAILGKRNSFMYESTVKRYGLKDFLKRLIVRLFFRFSYFDLHNKVKTILLLRPEYLEEDGNIGKRVVKAKYDHDILLKCFEEMNKVMEYRQSEIYENLDIVFFDSNHSDLGIIGFDEERRFIASALSCFNGKRILVKLRPCHDPRSDNFFQEISRNNSNIIIDNINNKIPWEIILFNNSKILKEVTFLSVGSSTMVTNEILFGCSCNKVIIGEAFFNDLGLKFGDKWPFKCLCKRIASSYGQNRLKLCFPKNLEELKNISKTLS
jgi:hypothetical protein